MSQARSCPFLLLPPLNSKFARLRTRFTCEKMDSESVSSTDAYFKASQNVICSSCLRARLLAFMWTSVQEKKKIRLLVVLARERGREASIGNLKTISRGKVICEGRIRLLSPIAGQELLRNAPVFPLYYFLPESQSIFKSVLAILSYASIEFPDSMRS